MTPKGSLLCLSYGCLYRIVVMTIAQMTIEGQGVEVEWFANTCANLIHRNVCCVVLNVKFSL